MRKAITTTVWVAVAMIAAGVTAWTCGDKLLILGRGVRFQADGPEQPVSILIYSHAGSPASEAVGDLKFQSALRDAGHKVQAVGSSQEFDQAVRRGKYDIVLADIADSAALGPATEAAPSRPVLLPAIYNGTKAETASGEKRYGCLLKMPGRTGRYLAEIDKAMDLKLKREHSKLRAI